MPGVRVEDGQDVLAVYAAVSEAVDRARRKEGPSLVEVMTYRFREHSEGLRINVDYRDKAERESWLARDPVVLFRDALILDGRVTAAAMDAMKTEIEAEVEASATFAMESPYPSPEVAFEDLYTEPYTLEDVL